MCACGGTTLFLCMFVYSLNIHMNENNTQLCDCGLPGLFLSKYSGKYRCAKSANSCPLNRKKNSTGLKKAHEAGLMPSFTKEMRDKSHVSHRAKLNSVKEFHELGPILRKKIVMEDQNFACSHCNLTEWMGLKITLELDHINGNNKDNARDNLRCLCPNCHSITDTWKIGTHKGKNTRLRTDEEIVAAFKRNASLNATLKELGYNWGSASTVKKVLFKYNLTDKPW